MVDTRTGKVLTTTAVSPGPLAIDEPAGRVFVASGSSPSIGVLDTRTGALVGTIETTDPLAPVLGRAPHAIGIDPSTGHVLVTNAPDDTVSVLDATRGTVLGMIAVGDSPVAIAVDPGTERAFVVNESSHDVSILATMLLHQ
jgi:YVTN family beta-propeller protein